MVVEFLKKHENYKKGKSLIISRKYGFKLSEEKIVKILKDDGNYPDQAEFLKNYNENKNVNKSETKIVKENG